MRKNFILFLLFVPMVIFAQTKLVTGKITGAGDGTPLPGVNILVKGTNIGTQSDSKGNYSIEVSRNDVLQFSFIGYKTQEIKITSELNGGG